MTMDVGMMMVFASYGWDGIGDDRVWEEEIRLARLAADLGFDCLWSAEHHFNDYSFVPDNLQLMTYLAALCPDVGLGTAAVILPWHDPLRVAEQAAVLDMLCKGRLRLGLGRGLARREFAAFRMSMDESRERFDEAAPMIVNALKTGFIEGNGKFYPQPRIEIRPRPKYSFDGRIYAVASSEDSIDSAAKLGAHIVMFRSQRQILPATAHRNPAASQIFVRRAHLCRRLERRLDRLRRQTRRSHCDVRRSPVGDAAAGHRTRPRIAPQIPRHPAAANHADRVLRVRHRPRRNRGGGAPISGQVCREQLLPLRVLGRAFQDREGLRRLSAEGRDRAPGRPRWGSQRFHAGGQLGHSRQDPARARSAPPGHRRFRAQRRLPLWRHSL